MSILINGIEMPPAGTGKVIMIDSDGDVWGGGDKEYTRIEGAKAIHIQPHGRLVDADEMIWKLTPDKEFYPTEEDRLDYDSGKLMVRDIRGFICDQPTVIPAEDVFAKSIGIIKGGLKNE